LTLTTLEKEIDMTTMKTTKDQVISSAKEQATAIKDAVVDRVEHITTNEKIAGAAVIGAAVGVAATVLGSSLLHASTAEKNGKTAKKPST
jgi:hypothetical protein